jgi:hypothetical protein
MYRPAPRSLMLVSPPGVAASYRRGESMTAPLAAARLSNICLTRSMPASSSSSVQFFSELLWQLAGLGPALPDHRPLVDRHICPRYNNRQ